MLLNIIAIISALPVITSGASLTALFDVSQRLVRGDDIYIVKTFFSSFRSNFKKGAVTGAIFILAAILVVLNYLAAREVAPVLRYCSMAIAMLLSATAIYTFALTARFENDIKGSIVNARSFQLYTSEISRIASFDPMRCHSVQKHRQKNIQMYIWNVFLAFSCIASQNKSRF
jgi:amino acid transporter